MNLDDRTVHDFRELFRERYGVELTVAEARKEATDFLLLLRMLLELDE